MTCFWSMHPHVRPAAFRVRSTSPSTAVSTVSHFFLCDRKGMHVKEYLVLLALTLARPIKPASQMLDDSTLPLPRDELCSMRTGVGLAAFLRASIGPFRSEVLVGYQCGRSFSSPPRPSLAVPAAKLLHKAYNIADSKTRRRSAASLPGLTHVAGNLSYGHCTWNVRRRGRCGGTDDSAAVQFRKAFPRLSFHGGCRGSRASQAMF